VSRVRTLLAVLAAAVVLSACGGAPVRVAALDDMERVRSTSGAREGATLAPEAYARAEQERDLAREAHASADDVAATLHALRAVAAYDHALTVARLARATTELADAQKSFDDATTQEASLDASRTALEREADELEQRVQIARERVLPASSAAASPEREAARLVAARSLAMQARLLCAAARLVKPDAAGLADAESEIVVLEQRPAKGQKQATIDDAARGRAHCLDVLTRARRGAGGDDAGAADALLAELSAAGGWDPSRDERGVAVTLRDAFRGAELADNAAARLKELGRVAGAHPLFAVQVVVHDARAPAAAVDRAFAGSVGTGPTDTTDARRAELAVQALVSGGAPASGVRAELAGARMPIVDPSDPKARGRNERLEVVFVGSRR
jgi:hypothetical protein